MRITIAPRYRPVVERTFAQNPAIPYRIAESGQGLTLEIPDAALSTHARQQIRLHFSYLDLFEWQGASVVDVRFWERAERFSDVARDFAALTADLHYDLLAPIEARGFLLGGMLGHALGLPMLPVRKDRPSYGRFAGVANQNSRVPFTNWKGEAEALFVFSRPWAEGQRALIVDDLLDTGHSLAAAIEALAGVGCVPVGAFYLCDVLPEERCTAFRIPIRAFVRQRSL